MADFPSPPPGFQMDGPAPPPPAGFKLDGSAPGIPFQFAAGFNRALSKYTEAPERSIILALDVLHLARPDWDDTAKRAYITNWLRGGGVEGGMAAPDTPGKRIAHRAGEVLGENVPYMAMGSAGAPRVAAVGRAPGAVSQAEISAVQSALDEGKTVSQVAKTMSAPVGSIARNSAVTMAEGIKSAPLGAMAGEAAAVLGSGGASGLAREVAPGNETVDTLAQIAGGVAPAALTYTPTALAMRGGKMVMDTFSPEATRRAAIDTVKKAIGPELSAPARADLAEAQRLRGEMPGFSPSLAEATGSPQLIATQRAAEARAKGPEASALENRRIANQTAVDTYRQKQAPEGLTGPEFVIDTATRRVENLRTKIGDEEKLLDGGQMMVANRLPYTNRASEGARLRTAIDERDEEAKVRIAKLADDLGISDVNITAPFRALQDDTKKLISEGGAFADRTNIPTAAKDILNFGRRSDDAMRTLLREIRYGSDQKPKDLMAFIRSKGGLKDDAGELRARDLHRGPGSIVRANGMSLDEMARAASEAGYFSKIDSDAEAQGFSEAFKRGTPDDLLAMIDQQKSGKPVFSDLDRDAVARLNDVQAFRRELDMAGINLNHPDEEIIRRMEFETGTQSPATVTFNDLKGLRERVGEDLRDAMSSASPSAKKIRLLTALQRRVDKFIEGATISEPGLNDRYKQFRQAYKTEYVDRFRQGATFKVRARNGQNYFQTPDERVADAFWRDVEGARQFKRTFGDDAPETESLESVVLDDLRNFAVRNGKVVPSLFQAWRRKHEKVLDEFHSLRGKIDDIGSLNDAMLRRAGQLHERETIVERSLLAREIGAYQRGKSADQIISDALRNPKLMVQLSRRVRGTPAANGLKRAVWDKVANATVDELDDFLKTNQASLKIALSPKHIESLNNILTATRQIGRVPTPPAKPFDPNHLADLEKSLGTGLNQISSRVFAVHSGRTSARYAAAELLGRFFRGRKQVETQRLMDEALFNPEIAADIVDMINLPAKRTETAKRLNTWLLNIGTADEEGGRDGY